MRNERGKGVDPLFSDVQVNRFRIAKIASRTSDRWSQQENAVIRLRNVEVGFAELFQREQSLS